jgi:hypothetical protein
MSYSDEGDDFEDEDEPPQPLRPPSPEELQRRKKRTELWRLFSEVNTTVKCMKIVGELNRLCSELREGFLVFAYRALFDDALSSLMRVLDNHPGAFSIWKLDEETIEAVCLERKIDLARVRAFSTKLKTARDKLQFHIDRRHVENPERLWTELDIRHSEITEISHNLATIIGDILLVEHNFPANLSKYDAGDVEPIIEQLRRANLGNFRTRSN